jgi:hypothetical protein
MTTAVTATPSLILHMQAKQAKHPVIALEAHGDGVDVACHRNIIGGYRARICTGGCWVGFLC